MTALRGNPVAYDEFYKTARWQRLRRLQLVREPSRTGTGKLWSER